MAEHLTRRQALKLAAGMGGALAAGAALPACGSSVGNAGERDPYPWPYLPLDLTKSGELGYENYRVGHCAYAVFTSIAGQVANFLGEPFTFFPFDMWRFGAAGIANWGTVCGTVNGASAAIALFFKEPDDMISELLTWYENTALPVYEPENPVLPMDMPATEAASPLCHLSVGKWIKASGFEASSPERTERCARLAADVTRKTVEILNLAFDRRFVFHGLDPQTQECLACHGQGKKNDDIKSQMHCTTCHD
ncbi:MAG: C-GCAxxG-C-C family protein [Thermodesulfobacteriota bacterium]